MREENGMKRCSRCGETQPVSEFHHNFGTPDGYQNWCKSCYREVQAVHRARRRERNLARFRAKGEIKDAGNE